MDRETISQYGWLIVALIILSIVISFATPLFGFVTSKIAVIPDKVVGAALGTCKHTETTDSLIWQKYDLRQHTQLKITVCNNCEKTLKREYTGLKENHDFSESTVCPACGCSHSHYYTDEVSRRYEQIPLDYTRHNCFVTRKCFCGAEKETMEKRPHNFVDDVCTDCGFNNNAFAYTISFNPNKKNASDTVTNMPENISKKRNVDVIIPLITPVYSGYTFEGWALTPDGVAVYHKGDAYSENLSITLYAVWSHTHVYNQEVVDMRYFFSPANCRNLALYYKSCICGQSAEGHIFTDEKFPYGEYGNHVWRTDLFADYIMNPLYDYSEVTGGPVAVAYLRATTIGVLLGSLYDSGHNEIIEDIDANTPITPCPNCGKNNVKSAKLYSIYQTLCSVKDCNARNTSYVLAWECYACSNTNTQQIPALHNSHTFGEWYIVTPPTCQTKGLQKRVCTHPDCDAYESEEIPTTHHKTNETKTVYTSEPCSNCGEAITGWKNVGTCIYCGTEFVTYSTQDPHTCPDGGGTGGGEGDAYCPNAGCHAKLEWREGYHYLGDDWPDAPKHAANYYCPSCREYVVWGKIIFNCVEKGIAWSTYAGVPLGETPCPNCDSVGTLAGYRYRCTWCNEDMGGEARCQAEDCLTRFVFNKGESF